ncbi:MAG: aminotransferase class [Solirubrobacterales bacterium]|jgi:branched-chain amino acid aminotransferase|nr:aminotransferase class [Solirubrobacterales bacterium]
MSVTCLDGRVMPTSEATISVTDEGLLRGDGVFEVIRVYDGQPFALDDHLARLGRSAENLRLPVDVEAVRADVAAVLEATPEAERDGCLRVVVTRGGRRILIVEPAPAFPETIALASVVYAPTRVLDGVKSLSYASNMLATRLAREQGADEALLLTPHGRVLEGTTSSFFWARDDGVLRTPPLSDHILASITRARLLEELEVVEEPCSREELDRVEEAFLASTNREIHPVHAIDGRALPVAPGPLTRAADAAFRARVERELGVPAT